MTQHKSFFFGDNLGNLPTNSDKKTKMNVQHIDKKVFRVDCNLPFEQDKARDQAMHAHVVLSVACKTNTTRVLLCPQQHLAIAKELQKKQTTENSLGASWFGNT